MATAILDQQQLFAQAYVPGHGNATQAAIEAGYNPVSAGITAVAYTARPGRHQAGAGQEDVDSSGADHGLDAMRYGVHRVTWGREIN